MALKFENEDDLSDFVVRKGHGVKGLVDSGISHVPDRFLQPLSERIADDLPTSEAIPPIDLSKLDGPEHDQIVDAIVKGAEIYGFLHVVNHGVSSKLLNSILMAAHRFFNQPAQVKAAYLQGVSPTPLVFYGSSFGPNKEKHMEWRDLLSMIYTNDAEALQHWPAVCKEEAVEYLHSTMEIVRKIFKILVKNLKVSLDSKRMESLTGNTRLNMNYYPACPNPEQTIGAKKHSDMNMLTLLHQDSIGGLQMKMKMKEYYINGFGVEKEKWILVTPFPNALIINVGDALEIISNGHYKSVEHRVKTTREKSRVSIPMFISPLPMENIGPLSELIERNGVARYRESSYKDYTNNFFLNPEKPPLDFVKIDSFV